MNKLSVMIGNKPTGLDDFLTIARPTVLYSLNNNVRASVQRYSPDTKIVLRIQNDVYGRVPYRIFEIDPVTSARRELIEKTQYIPKIGHVNLLELWRMGQADFHAPMCEPVLGEMIDHVSKAQWLNAWYEAALDIAHEAGLHLAIWSFATGNPRIDLIQYLIGSARKAKAGGDVIDLHEYGVTGALMDNPQSGALRYREIYAQLPDDARCPIVISECGAGNGYNTGMSGAAFVNDLVAYGRALLRDDFCAGACTFQLDAGAESHIDYQTLMLLARKGADLQPPATRVNFYGQVLIEQQAALDAFIAGLNPPGVIEWAA